MLDQLLQNYRLDFGIEEIKEAQFLEQVRVSSFVWSEQDGTLCLAANKKYFQLAAENPSVKAIVCPASAVIDGELDKAVIVAAQADQLFYVLHNQAIHSLRAAPSLEHIIAESALIHPSAIVEHGVQVGADVEIGPHCLVMAGTIIGDGCVLHAGAMIGTQGFFSKWLQGKKQHIAHYGGVRLGKNCIVHAGTNISRSVNFNEFTELGNDVHIGIQSNIAHDCKIGNAVDISAKVLLAGRVNICDRAWIGAGVIVSNALTIGVGADVKIGSVLINDVADGAQVSGNFASSHKRRIKEHLRER
jgi:UDP-3-O-[3-hydroxymyristoyl] glucosamine N-acyltransferase